MSSRLTTTKNDRTMCKTSRKELPEAEDDRVTGMNEAGLAWAKIPEAIEIPKSNSLNT